MGYEIICRRKYLDRKLLQNGDIEILNYCERTALIQEILTRRNHLDMKVFGANNIKMGNYMKKDSIGVENYLQHMLCFRPVI